MVAVGISLESLVTRLVKGVRTKRAVEVRLRLSEDRRGCAGPAPKTSGI